MLYNYRIRKYANYERLDNHNGYIVEESWDTGTAEGTKEGEPKTKEECFDVLEKYLSRIKCNEIYSLEIIGINA